MKLVCKAAKDIAANAETVHMSVPGVVDVHRSFANLRQQRYHDVLLDLGPQLCIAEDVTSKEEDIALDCFSVQRGEGKVIEGVDTHLSACWRTPGS